MSGKRETERRGFKNTGKMAKHHKQRSTSYQDHILLCLLIICSVVHLVSCAYHADCPCNAYSEYKTMRDVYDYVEAGGTRQLQCCVFGALGFNDLNASVQWTFNGKPLTDDKLGHLFCKNETLYLRGVEETDGGTYVCTVTATNGTSRSLNFHLSLCKGTDGYREGPKDVKVMKTCAQEGGKAELRCEALVGMPGCSGEEASISWWFYNRTLRHLPEGALMEANTKADRNGILRNSLIIKSVRREHFGNYICLIRNEIGSNKGITTLMEGDPEHCGRSTLPLLATACAAAAACVVVCMTFCWWRFRRSVALTIMMHRRKKQAIASLTSPDGFLNDVFIIHGQTASNWIYEFLLPKLEEKYGYTCFLPGRDMLGGDLYPDAICSNMKKCRRILVVKTPCLLQSKWSSWTTQQGVKTWITSSSSRIMAITLQEFGTDAVSLETAGLLKTLEAVKETIKVPQTCRMQDSNQISEVPVDIYVEKSQENNKKELGRDSLRLDVPIYSGSPLPESMRLSNMITGSNHASRENLDEIKDTVVKDGTEVKGLPVLYINNEDGIEEDDLGSPCSNSPFILPSSNAVSITQKESLHCCSGLLKCLNDVFVGDPEVIFWQKLRLFLEFPTQGRKRNITVQSTV